MKLLNNISESIHLNRLRGAPEDKVKNAFFANYLAGLLFLKVQDFGGLHLVNDPRHTNLKSFSDSMSEINFWGRALFHPEDRQVDALMMRGHADILKAEAGRILPAGIQAIVKVPVTSPERINWSEVVMSLMLLKHRFGLNSTYFDQIVSAIHRWDSLRENSRNRALQASLMYLMQNDSQSNLLPRMRSIAGQSVMGDLVTRIVNFKRLAEDGEGTSAGDVGSTDSSASNAIVTPSHCQDLGSKFNAQYKLDKAATNQVSKKSKIKFKDGKIIARKAKAFKRRKFKAPDSVKPAREAE